MTKTFDIYRTFGACHTLCLIFLFRSTGICGGAYKYVDFSINKNSNYLGYQLKAADYREGQSLLYLLE